MRNLREYASKTRFGLVLWFVAILFIVGLGLIWIIYGDQAAFLGFICLLAAGIPVGLIALFMLLLDRISGPKQ